MWGTHLFPSVPFAPKAKMSAELTILSDHASKVQQEDTIQHVEGNKSGEEGVVLVSKWTHLTTHQAIFKFRRVFFLGLIASFGGM